MIVWGSKKQSLRKQPLEKRFLLRKRLKLRAMINNWSQIFQVCSRGKGTSRVVLQNLKLMKWKVQIGCWKFLQNWMSLYKIFKIEEWWIKGNGCRLQKFPNTTKRLLLLWVVVGIIWIQNKDWVNCQFWLSQNVYK